MTTFGSSPERKITSTERFQKPDNKETMLKNEAMNDDIEVNKLEIELLKPVNEQNNLEDEVQNLVNEENKFENETRKLKTLFLLNFNKI